MHQSGFMTAWDSLRGCCVKPLGCIALPMNDTLHAITMAVVARLPEWVRHDLTSKDQSARTRAEETIAAMITNALTEAGKG